MTIWELLEQCVRQLDEPFRRSEIIGWFRRHHPEVLESSLAVHIQGATADVAGRGPFASRPPLLVRVDRGIYRRATTSDIPPRKAKPEPSRPIVSASPTSANEPIAVLVGCVKSKGTVATRAADLYTSELFRRRRSYAESTALPWFILSAEHGLLRPETVVAPYDRALADQPAEYRAAWAWWVAVKLDGELGDVNGRRVEIHAGSAYIDALREPLRKRSCAIDSPLQGLRFGEQLAWYGEGDGSDREKIVDQADDTVAQLATSLSAGDAAVPANQIIADHAAVASAPGLYSWWVDAAGARDLTRGLGTGVSPGLIYAGQAGATRWPSGRRSGSTLRERIVGMHLQGNIEFSTFRRTLWAILRAPLAFDESSEAGLSEWMAEHLQLVAVPVPDADGLVELEAGVLQRLDPPLNLAGRRETEVRRRISALRRSQQT